MELMKLKNRNTICNAVNTLYTHSLQNFITATKTQQQYSSRSIVSVYTSCDYISDDVTASDV